MLFTEEDAKLKVDVTVHFKMEDIKDLLNEHENLKQFVLDHIEDMKTWVMSFQEGGMQVNSVEVTDIEEEQISNETPSKKATPKIKLEDVRHLLATLSQSGKQKEVKALIQKFGAKKLTDIPEEKYPELLEKAEAI